MTVLLPHPVDEQTWAGATWPLGATFDAASQTTTFAVHSPAATRVTVEIYSFEIGHGPIAEALMVKGPDGVWRARLACTGPGTRYGYRAWGGGWAFDEAWAPGGSSAGFRCDVDEHGNRFNPNKLLFDPYAREVTHTPVDDALLAALTAKGLDAGVFGTGGGDCNGRPRREVDTGPYAPKGIVVADTTPTGTKPKVPPQDAVIYEAHVKGLTAHPTSASLRDILSGTAGFENVQDVPDELRGTYLGAAAMAPYLKALGITTIELLPVHLTLSSPGAAAAGLSNYWGYQSLSFFAPHPGYAHDREPGGPTREVKTMVKAFHDAGLEVYLDVVYNHTGEGGCWGGDVDTMGLTSLAGLAAPEYYVRTPSGHLDDGATGCSNQTNASSPAFQRLVLDSLAYWADECGVDGFRFDLATVLGREWTAADHGGFHTDHPLLAGIRDLARARDIEVVAEPWDLRGYEVGAFPDGWSEWNGAYRDVVRGFLKGFGGAGAFAAMIDGDAAAYGDQGGPSRCVDFVTAHDGFTLCDLVSYNGKLNDQPWPFGPSDGGNDNNLSWDSGGDQALRRARIRSFWAVLLLSRGVPMVVAGDELGRSQNGNNNPWCLDTLGMWVNWAQAGASAPSRVPVDPDDPSRAAYHDDLGQGGGTGNPILSFARSLATLRASRASLRQSAYGSPGAVEYRFMAPDGSPLRDDLRAVAWRIVAGSVHEPDLLVCANMDAAEQAFTLPEDARWSMVADTSAAAEAHGNAWAPGSGPAVEGHVRVAPWCVAVLQAG